MNRTIHFLSTSRTALILLLATLLNAATAQGAWADTETVSYIDADGNAQTHEATVLTGNEEPSQWGSIDLSAGWYVVKGNISYTNQINYSNPTGTIHIILADGAQMSVEYNGYDAISLFSYHPLAIYGQSAGTGRLSVTSDHIAIYASGGITINGGIVSATSTGNGRPAISANNGAITINGGQVTATPGNNAKGIVTEGTITLGLRSTSDFITANGYYGTVNIKDGQTLYDQSGNAYTSNGVSIPDNATLRSWSPDDFSVNGAGTEYTIHTATGWNVFCDLLESGESFSGKTVRLGADITVTRMAGGDNHEFTGTFDGGGKTLTVNYANTGNNTMTAPFSYVDGATIQNLIVSGTISGTAYRAAGIIGETVNTTSHITNCVSNVDISSGRYTGGFSIGGNVEIEGCVFNGKIVGTTYSGGFIGYSYSAQVIKNSLFAPQDGSSISGGTFYYNGGGDVAPVNSYYTQALGTAQGKACHSVTAGDNVTIEAIALTGTATQYTVSGITAYSGGGLQRGQTLYYGSGDHLSLTLSSTGAPLGYQYSAYTASSGTLSGTTLTMPDADVTINTTLRSDGQQHEVSYMTADGTTQTAKAIALDGHETRTSEYGNQYVDLAAGWYYVGTDIDYTGITLSPQGNITLILADGCTMHIGTAENRTGVTGIERAICDLTIYGQSLDAATAGTISYEGTGGRGFYVSNYTQHSGNVSISNSTYTGGSGLEAGSVTLNGGKLSVATNSKYAIAIETSEGDITINGGQLDATATGSGDIYGLYANGTNRNIILGWTNPADCITASSYYATGTVAVADGQTLADESGNIYSGTLNASVLSGFATKTTLQPCLALADAADNTAAIANHAGKKLAVALSGRTLYKDGFWNTLCLPFGVDLNATDCPLYGATARTVTAASISGSTLNLTFGVAVNTLVAGTPYIIKWDGDGTSNIENPVFEGVTIDATERNYDNGATGDTRVRFCGTYKSTAFDSEDKSILLMGAENTLFYPITDSGIGAQRAYFKIGDDGELLAPSLTAFNIDFGDDDSATGIIDSLSPTLSQGEGAWYSIDGRKLDGKPTQHGIYINNGKKVVIK